MSAPDSMSALDQLHRNWRASTPTTWLYAPANDERKAGKVGTFGSDAVILDLEDAVPLDEKAKARGMARDLLQACPDTVLRCVRVNHLSTDLTAGDLGEIVTNDLDFIVYPKAESREELRAVDDLIARAEHEQGLAPGRIGLLALVESAVGISRIEAILTDAPSRLLTVGFGLGDFSLDMGVQLTDFGTELDYPRARLAIAARAAGLAYAVDGPWLRIRDLDGLRTDSRRSRSLGLAGRQLIHPSHVGPTLLEYQGLSPERIDFYRRVVSEFESSSAQGVGAFQVDGELVDYPIYYQAQRVLAALPVAEQ